MADRLEASFDLAQDRLCCLHAPNFRERAGPPPGTKHPGRADP
jgi:hypothetical protein